MYASRKAFCTTRDIKSRLNPADIRNIDKYRGTLDTKTLNLTSNLAVHTTYFTVFRRNGLTHFRKDVYEYDKFIQDSQK